MPNNQIVEPFLVAVLAALLVLIIEYSVFKPIERLEMSTKRRLTNAVIALITLFAPLFLLQIFSVKLSESFGTNITTVKRVDIYANIYGFLALLWGYLWASFVRHLVNRLIGD